MGNPNIRRIHVPTDKKEDEEENDKRQRNPVAFLANNAANYSNFNVKSLGD